MVNTIIHFKDGETLTVESKNADAINLGNDTHLTIFGAQNDVYVIEGSTVKYVKMVIHESEDV